MNSRPNILLITTDEQRWDHLGLEGVRGIDTPNLDRLGREGVHFHRAYTPSPLCTPARVSLLTGLYPSAHGAYSIGVTADPFPSPTLADRLGDAGYHTALFGKAHFVGRDFEDEQCAGFPNPPPEFFRTFTGPALGFQEIRTSKGHTTNQRPNLHYRAWLERLGVPYGDWYPDVDGVHDHSATGVWNIPPEYHDTTWVSQNTIDYIGRQATADAPWFCWASFQDPHEPFLCPEPWYSRVRTDEMELLPGAQPGEWDDKPAWYRRVAEQGDWSAFDDGNGVPCCGPRHDLDGKEAEAMQATLGMVAFIDDRVGAILQALEDSGQADNTLVLFTSDHGDIHGHHGLWHKGLLPYEDCQRVPLLAWGPGLVKPQGRTDGIANIVDLPRTIIEAAGLEVPQGMQGVSLLPVLRGETDRVRDCTIVEMQANPNVYQQTLVTDRWKLIVYRDLPDGELYDLDADPHQHHNLWDRPEHGADRQRLLHRFVQENMAREGRTLPRHAFA